MCTHKGALPLPPNQNETRAAGRRETALVSAALRSQTTLGIMAAVGVEPGKISFALVRHRDLDRLASPSSQSTDSDSAASDETRRSSGLAAQGAHHLIKTEQWEPALSWLEQATEAGHVELLQLRQAKAREQGSLLVCLGALLWPAGARVRRARMGVLTTPEIFSKCARRRR